MGHLENKTLLMYFRWQTWAWVNFPVLMQMEEIPQEGCLCGPSTQSLALGPVSASLLQEHPEEEDKSLLCLGIMPSVLLGNQSST